MQYVDGIFLGVMGLFVFFGFKGGILKRGVAVVFLVVGLVLATRTMHTLGTMLTGWWSVHEVVGAVLAFVLVILGTALAAFLIMAIMGRHSQPPRLWSRLTGAVIGLVESAIYLSLILVFLSVYSLPSQETRKTSILYGHIRDFAPLVFDKTNELFGGSRTFDDELKESLQKLRLAPPD
jgi:hypothetical protein